MASAIIIGAGEVGASLARELADDMDVVVIDTDRAKLERLSELVDAQVMHGHGASAELLTRAGADRAQLLIAVTNLDEVNMIAAMTATRLGVGRTVARIRNQQYLQGTQVVYRDVLGIDVVISPEVVSAIKLVDIARTPGAVEVENFARGKIKMVQIPLDENSPVVGRPLKHFAPPQGFNLVALERSGDVIIPTGDDVLDAGDRAFVISKAKQLEDVRKIFGAPERQVRKVLIVGGDEIARVAARNLERAEIDVCLVHPDERRCRELSEALVRSRVVRGEGTDVSLLKEEGIAQCHLLMALSDNDEQNIVVGMLAKELGAPKTAVLVQRSELVPLVERFGIDTAVSPRQLTANTIFGALRRGQVVSLARLLDGKAEIVEMVVSQHSKVAGEKLKDIHLPKGMLVGAIQKLRKNELIIPRGEAQFEAGDHVILFALPSVVGAIQEYFA